jgi:hypothetical protein
MICRLCHADHDGPALCPACVKDLSAVYWGSGGLRTVDFPRISGAGRSAGVLNGGAGAMPAATRCLGTAEANPPTKPS